MKSAKSFNPKHSPYIFPGSVTMAANSISQLVFNVDAGFIFWGKRFSYKSTVSSANAIPTFDIQILNNDIAIFKDFVPNEMFAGMMTETSTAPDTRYVTGLANWHPFDVPQKFMQNSNIIIKLRETAGVASTIYFAIEGIKEQV